MPRSGRAQPFGPQAGLQLVEADHAARVPFGSKPPLQESDRNFRLSLRWRASGYDVVDTDGKPAGRIAVRPLPGTAKLFVAQTLWDGDAAFSYRLVARQSDGSFVYYHDNEECDAVQAAELDRILTIARDRAACRPSSWRQVEALLLAFARTGPQPFGVAIPLPPP
ncbi:hypothetical protein [Sandarakinorhabdus rubra]|uniref:hypothetical protein n=1 Tax=Sandarakinorhabdus rubra TaxID=2672568 RepID=UPI0013DA2B03|nr:hypothetical protein [Sandarakinorhabdus rubra]